MRVDAIFLWMGGAATVPHALLAGARCRSVMSCVRAWLDDALNGVFAEGAMGGILLAVGTLLLVSGEAPAAGGPMAAPVTIAADKAGTDQRVCRTERSLGSRVVKRVCKTAAERRQDELDARTNIKLGSGRKGQPTDAFKRPESN